MIPLLAVGGVTQAADAAVSGMAWLNAQLTSASQTSNTSSSENGGTGASAVDDGNGNPTSFASLLAAQGVSAPTANTATAGAALPAVPSVSAAGQAVAGGHSHSGSGHARIGFTL